MNAADVLLIRWLQMEIRTGRKTIAVPAALIENASREGLEEARALARISGCQLVIEA